MSDTGRSDLAMADLAMSENVLSATPWSTVRWTVIIPVKRLEAAKSRLRPELANVPELALAFAMDTVAAAVAASNVAEVIVVTSDARVLASMKPLGVTVVDDPGPNLNAAIAAGIERASGCIAVITGDLPALRPADLAVALALAEAADRAMVADHSGTGTTLIAAMNASLLHPQFGRASRDLHEKSGHTVLDIPIDSPLRWDVDTADDLAAALRLGVGSATAAAVALRAGP